MDSSNYNVIHHPDGFSYSPRAEVEGYVRTYIRDTQDNLLGFSDFLPNADESMSVVFPSESIDLNYLVDEGFVDPESVEERTFDNGRNFISADAVDESDPRVTVASGTYGDVDAQYTFFRDNRPARIRLRSDSEELFEKSAMLVQEFADISINGYSGDPYSDSWHPYDSKKSMKPEKPVDPENVLEHVFERSFEISSALLEGEKDDQV